MMFKPFIFTRRVHQLLLEKMTKLHPKQSPLRLARLLQKLLQPRHLLSRKLQQKLLKQLKLKLLLLVFKSKLKLESTKNLKLRLPQQQNN